MKKYWVMKTSEDNEGKIVANHWMEFKDPKQNDGKTVVAIGWGAEPKLDPDNITKQGILAYVTGKYYPGEPGKAKMATSTIWQFLHDMNIGDEVILCTGYPPLQKKPVFIYGIAEIKGDNWNHIGSSWGFHLKREVLYTNIIEKDVSVFEFKELIGKGSLRKTIHEIKEESKFKQTKEWLIQSFPNKNKTRSPAWTRDELILALNLYFSLDKLPSSEQHPGIIELSKLLNDLPIHSLEEHRQQFRNPNGVYMKLCNFLRLDPDYHGKGLDSGSKLDVEVWNEYYNDKDKLKEIAEIIVRDYKQMKTHRIRANEIDEDEEFPEGKIIARYHKYKERNQSLVSKKKKLVLQKNGNLACEVCGFDFADYYGERGEGFAECHHNVSLSSTPDTRNIKLSDLSIICSNCHRVIHKKRPWLAVAELKKLLENRHKYSK